MSPLKVRFEAAFLEKVQENQCLKEMSQTSKKMREEPARLAKADPWQRLARDVLRDAVAQRAMSSRQLAELLYAYGVEIEPTTLSKRITRGTFDAGFFLMCLSALGAERVDILENGAADARLKSERVWLRSRSKS